MSDVRTLIAVAEKHPPAPTELPEVPLYVDPENPDVTSGSRLKRPWRIGGEAEAEWALQKKGEAEAEIARVLALAEKAKAAFAAKVDARAAEIVAGQQRRSQFFEAVLLEWMYRARSTILKGKTKSRKLLFGTLGWRSSPKKLVYDDEKAALAWARAKGIDAGLVRVTFALEKDAVKRYCAANDVLPAGAHAEGGEDVPFVEADPPPPLELPAANDHHKET